MTAMDQLRTVVYERISRVGILTLNAADTLNALTERQMSEVERVLDDAAKDESLGAFILTGVDKAFCVGVHFEILDRCFEDIRAFEALVRRVSGIAERIEALPMPTIAAVNGHARAAGFEISLGCDFALIADEARCGDVHTDVGVIPGAGAMRLARRVGEQRAKELVWSSRWWSAAEAVAAGYALKSVPRARLRDEAIAFASTLSNKSRPALQASKRVFQEAAHLAPGEAREFELCNFIAYMGSATLPREFYLAARENFRQKQK
ncbi:enoyl-CoA hydratase/isomerase family protein [Ramlibacter sp.]|uniref:enoyl-CoA hydratase/isomerase family protein n=1 Tax=Ramlibacter sp. TaxID=1917967 RepID=UPI003D0B8DA8